MIGLLAIAAFSSCFVMSQPSDGGIVCRILTMKIMRGVEPEQTLFYCERQSDKVSFKLELPKSFIDQHKQLDVGETIISIQGGHVVEASNGRDSYVNYPIGAHISVIKRSPNRRLVTAHSSIKTIGVRKTLIVRVTSLDSQSSVSRKEMGGRILGLGGALTYEARNIISQTQACSFGKLTYVPTNDTGTYDGVIDVSVPLDLRTTSLESYTSQLYAPVEAIYGKDLSSRFDNVIFCLPPTATLKGEPFAAGAFLNHFASFYNDKYCIQLSFLMHELGHNFGLMHSSTGSHEYGDRSCSLGMTENTIGGPAMCYNGQKNWYLKWYADRQVEIDGTAAWTGKLAAFTDYNETTNGEHVVIAKVGNHYLQYNKAEKFNAEVRGSQNLITITSIIAGGHSNLTGTLGFKASNAGSIFYINNFLGTSYTMVIEACDRVEGKPDYFVLSAHLDDGFQSSYCRGGVQKSRAPSAPPSATPSSLARPSSSPTPAPVTRPPSPPPSPAPTFRTAPPTRPPTSNAPTSTPLDCKDSRVGVFWADGGRWAAWRDCEWLAKSVMWQARLCYAPLHHAARNVCPKLCGVCSNECSDDKTFTMLVQGQQVGCDWLSVRRGMAAHLCKRKDVGTACQETCDKCPEI